MVASTVNGSVLNGSIPNVVRVNGKAPNGTANGHLSNGYTGNSGARQLMKRNESLWKQMTFKQLFVLNFILTSLLMYYLQWTAYLYPVVFLLMVIPVLSGYLGVQNFLYIMRNTYGRVSKIDDYIEFLDDGTKARFSGKFIPVRDLYELYAEGKLKFKRDVLDCLEHRREFVTFKLQWWHLKFFYQKFVPEMFVHDQKQDREQVCDHYNRGNDFYRSFLGPLMVYTSGIQYNDEDTLEEMQTNKLREVCRKVASFVNSINL